MTKTEHLIADAAGFLKNIQLQDLGDEIYTVSHVVSEIKDKATRERLQVLPYELHMREPTVESIKLVTEFSKKTGDYFTLSATDMRVLALTYEVHIQHLGHDGIRTEPRIEVTGQKPTEFAGIGGKQLPGFYNPDAEGSADDGDQEEEEDSENDSDKCWIAPDNLIETMKELGIATVDETAKVACLTTDFAMQNTLIQMGLNVVSVDGMLIRQPKIFILRCFGCFKTTSRMDSKFCGHCGNKTLKRVAVTLDEDGTKHVHINFTRPINARGTRFCLPTPKGGQHAVNPILCADQPYTRNRLSNVARSKTDALHDDYLAENSPFAINDLFSRAANVKGQVKSKSNYLNRKNPNVVIGKRK